MWVGYDDKTAKAICYDCGSPVSKAAYNYFRTALHYSPDKVWAEMLDDKALYFATRAKNHVRLIEIAVRSSEQGRGVGKEVLFRLLSRMKRAGLYKLTFRTPIVEEAQNFWLHLGARIIDVKGEDYEMELTIKQD
jgi:GNAT superfamily N-acetyltransferase